MRLIDRLRGCGYDDSPEAFHDVLVDTIQAMYPDWSDEELLFHPVEAMRYCNVVRGKTVEGIPDHLVLRILLAIRKRDWGESE